MHSRTLPVLAQMLQGWIQAVQVLTPALAVVMVLPLPQKSAVHSVKR